MVSLSSELDAEMNITSNAEPEQDSMLFKLRFESSNTIFDPWSTEMEFS